MTKWTNEPYGKLTKRTNRSNGHMPSGTNGHIAQRETYMAKWKNAQHSQMNKWLQLTNGKIGQLVQNYKMTQHVTD